MNVSGRVIVGGSKSVILEWRSEKEDLRRVRAVCSDWAVVRERSVYWDLESR